jgi:phenylacetic acid degradation operon negative regulatory protein
VTLAEGSAAGRPHRPDPVEDDRSEPRPEGRPLTARSMILSVLLGTHPARLPVRALIRLGALLGVSEGTLRVALSRMAADGEVVASGGWYDLSPRLLERQRRLDQGHAPELRPWRGHWELAALSPTLTGTDRSEVSARLVELRLAPLHEGVWLRPANLARPWPGELPGCDRFETRPQPEPGDLARRLWDLPAWARHGQDLLGRFDHEGVPARRFALAAAMARHLRTDPVLPPGLLPDDWPGTALRRAYRAYEAELARLLGPTGRQPAREGSAGREASSRHNDR